MIPRNLLVRVVDQYLADCQALAEDLPKSEAAVIQDFHNWMIAVFELVPDTVPPTNDTIRPEGAALDVDHDCGFG